MKNKAIISKRKAVSTSELSINDPPFINNKPIPLHFEKSPRKTITHEKVDDFEFYGCIVPSYMKKLQTTLYRTIDKFDTSKTERMSKRQKSSQLILFKYIKRKQKRLMKQPQGNNLLETFYSTQNQTEQKQQPPKKKQKLSLPKPLSFYQTQENPHSSVEVQHKWTDNLPYKYKENKYQQRLRRNGEQNNLKHWRSRLVDNAQSQRKKFRIKDH